MTEVPLVQGLSARPIHAEPSIDFDWRAVNNWFSRFLPAGFYSAESGGGGELLHRTI